jgi:hypothetical protein
LILDILPCTGDRLTSSNRIANSAMKKKTRHQVV